MQRTTILICALIITFPVISWCAPDVMKIKAQGLQLGMSLEQANLETGHILVEDLPCRTLDYLVFRPDARSHLDYDLALHFTNTETPKLFELSLERKFYSHLDTHSLIAAYREKFGEYTDFCAQKVDDKELTIMVWGGEILSCATPEETLSIMSESYIQVSIVHDSSGSQTDIVLTLHNGNLMAGERMMLARKNEASKIQPAMAEPLGVSEASLDTQPDAAKPVNLASADAPGEEAVLMRPAPRPVPEARAATSSPPVQEKETEDKSEAETAPHPAVAEKPLMALTGKPTLAASAPKPVANESSPVGAATPIAEKTLFVLQAGSYKDPAEARETADRFSAKNPDITIAKFYDSKGNLWHIVQAGIFDTRTGATEKAAEFARIMGVKCLIKEIPAALLAERVYYRVEKVMEKADPVEPVSPEATADKTDAGPGAGLKTPIVATDQENRFVVQIGAFKTLKYAEECASLYKKEGYKVDSATFSDKGNNTWHSVFIGYFKDMVEARQFGESFSRKQKKAFVVKQLSELFPVKSAKAAASSGTI